MKTICLSLISLLISLGAISQKSDSLIEASAGTDVVSSFVWRGIRYTSSPAVQPWMDVSVGNFTIGAWSSVHFSEDWNEIDLNLGYENDFLMAGITDYYTSLNNLPDDYFDYRAASTAHMVELYAGYPGSEKIPFRFLLATTVFGDYDTNDDAYFSTFMELSYLFSLQKTDAELRLGFTPAEGMYADGANICEAAFRMDREMELKQNMELTVFSEITLNPVAKGLYLVGGLGIKF